MRFIITTVSIFVSLMVVGCSDSDEPLQGWKESDTEVVNEGTAPGTTRQVVAPGESTPMTGTNFDTSTDLDMITDEQLGLGVTDPDGDDRQPGSLADQLELDDGTAIRPSAEERPSSLSTRPTPAPSSPRTAPATETRSPRPGPAEQQPRPAPRPKPEPEPEPEPAEPTDTSQEEDDLPPIVIPTPEPDPPSPDETDPDPPSGDTALTDTTSADRDARAENG